MADISGDLEKILEAIYGEEVRGAIYDALVSMNRESSSAMEYAATAQDSAMASAASAEASAAEAVQKATEAEASATAALASEQTATGKAADATSAASRAAASEQRAASSEATATQKAQEAAASEASAAQSVLDVTELEESARQLRNETETYADQVNADKEIVNAAKTSAQASQQAAALSETNAGSSEQAALAAQTAAALAQQGAEAANTSAQSAKQDAISAKQAAETASSSAVSSSASASASATSAAQSATSAQQFSGKPPRPDQTTKTWWIWDAENEVYVDSHIGSEIAGPQGVGITDIELISGDHSPGTADIYAVELTDGTSYNISVWNGRNGEGAGDVLGISFDLTLPASGWQNNSITIANANLIALAAYKYYLAPYESSRETYLDCNVFGNDISTTGYITFTCDTEPDVNLSVNVVRFELSANG